MNPDNAGGSTMTGAQLIEDERRRQVERGRDAVHDQARHEPTLVVAVMSILQTYVRPAPGDLASQYADAKSVYDSAIGAAERIPEERDVRLLQIAGALIAAEIDRVQLRDRLARGPRKLSELTHDATARGCGA